MNRRISEICARYDLDYWIWMPAETSISEQQPRRAQELQQVDALFRDLPRLDAIFFPGGDPGNNPPELVIPYLRDIAARLAKPHPRAKIWLSLQWFDAKGIDDVYAWIERGSAGVARRPGRRTEQPAARSHARAAAAALPLRDYPDITHTVRSQYPVPWWDPAFNFTLGREPINPRPVFYAAVHDRTASHTDGFISYSDGVNDDLNKAIWSGWPGRPAATSGEIVREYTRFFFGERVADRAADGLLALEKNWEGPLATNGSVDGTLALWQALEREAPSLGGRLALADVPAARLLRRLHASSSAVRHRARAGGEPRARAAAVARGRRGDRRGPGRAAADDRGGLLFRVAAAHPGSVRVAVPFDPAADERAEVSRVGRRARRRPRLHRLSAEQPLVARGRARQGAAR